MTTAAAPTPHRLALYLQLIRWDRPAGWLLLLWPTLSALWLAAGGFPGWHRLAVFTLGTVLMRSAGCCINDVADREFDCHVRRTAQRPVTAGQIAPREALAVGAVLALAAFGLVLTTNPATVALSLPALAVAIAYPYAKRFVAMPQAVLGVAFSFGIPMAFAAVLAEPAVAPSGLEVLRDAVGAVESVSWFEAVPPLAWGLVVGNLFWVLAYDTEYAMVDREDDLKIGIRTSAITFGRLDVAAVMGCYGVFLGIWGLLGLASGLGRAFALGLAAAAALALWHWTLIRSRSREGCFKAFRLNHWLGFALFAGIVADLAGR